MRVVGRLVLSAIPWELLSYDLSANMTDHVLAAHGGDRCHSTLVDPFSQEPCPKSVVSLHRTNNIQLRMSVFQSLQKFNFISLGELHIGTYATQSRPYSTVGVHLIWACALRDMKLSIAMESGAVPSAYPHI